MPTPPAIGVRQAAGTYLATTRLTPWLVVILPGLSVLLVTLGQSHESVLAWAYLIGGVVVGGLAAAIQVAAETWRGRLGVAGRTEADRFHVAVRDAFQPVAELIAGMPSMGRAIEREARLREVCQQAVAALRLLLPDVDRLRTVVYGLNENADCMSCLAYHGRGEKPRPFEKGTARGDAALQMVADGDAVFVENLKATAVVVDYHGSGVGYKTFISASIFSGESGFGMVTVDAPTAGDLVSTDKQIVMLMADLLAIAFAEVVR